MKSLENKRSAFSLVEVVLAVGICSFALLAIFGLFQVVLRTNAETLSQQEVLGVTRTFSGYLVSTNAGFTNVFPWVKDPSSAPRIYIYSATNGTFQSGQESDTAFVNGMAARTGRLFQVLFQLSPNMPLRDASGAISAARPTVSDLPASASAYTNDASLALKVTIYDVPSVAFPLTNLKPVFTYDTVVPR